MDNIFNYNCNRMCRLCLCEGEGLLSIFSDSNRYLPQRIAACVNVEVYTTDKIPKMICTECLLKVDEWYEFKKCCEDSQAKLRHWNSSQNNRMYHVGVVIKEEFDSDVELLETSVCIKEEPAEICMVDMDYEDTESPAVVTSSSSDFQESSLLVPALECPASSHGLNAPQYHTPGDSARKRAPKALPKSATLSPYCSICYREFSNGYNRLRHERTVHNIDSESIETELGLEADNISEKALDISSSVEFAESFQFNNSKIVTEKEFTDYNRKIGNMILKLKCDCCNVQYATKKTLLRHLVKSMRIEPFSCFFCCISFPNRSQYMKHVNKKYCSQRARLIESGNCPFKAYQHYQCKVCDDLFVQKILLNTHLLNTHLNPDLPAECLYCRRNFQNNNEFKAHAQQGTCYYKIYCSICKISFSTLEEFETHSEIHDDKPPESENEKDPLQTSTSCPVCSKQFANPSNLKRHVKLAHRNFRWVKCTQCAMKFVLPEHLEAHAVKCHEPENDNTGSKANYSCVQCGALFSTLDRWCEHQKTHSTNNIHRCNECSRVFGSEVDLDHHKRTHSNIKLKLYRCSDSNSYKAVSDFSAPSSPVGAPLSPNASFGPPMKEEKVSSHKKPARKTKLFQQSQTSPEDHFFPCQFCDEYFETLEEVARHESAHKGPPKPFREDQSSSGNSKDQIFRTTEELKFTLQTVGSLQEVLDGPVDAPDAPLPPEGLSGPREAPRKGPTGADRPAGFEAPTDNFHLDELGEGFAEENNAPRDDCLSLEGFDEAGRPAESDGGPSGQSFPLEAFNEMEKARNICFSLENISEAAPRGNFLHLENPVGAEVSQEKSSGVQLEPNGTENPNENARSAETTELVEKTVEERTKNSDKESTERPFSFAIQTQEDLSDQEASQENSSLKPGHSLDLNKKAQGTDSSVEGNNEGQNWSKVPEGSDTNLELLPHGSSNQGQFAPKELADYDLPSGNEQKTSTRNLPAQRQYPQAQEQRTSQEAVQEQSETRGLSDHLEEPLGANLIVDIFQTDFLCKYCDQGFETREKLTAHETSHEKLASANFFSCDSCDQSFYTQEELDAHETAHKKTIIAHSAKNFQIQSIQNFQAQNFSAQNYQEPLGFLPSSFVTLGCRSCNQYFRTRQELADHQLEHRRTLKSSSGKGTLSRTLGQNSGKSANLANSAGGFFGKIAPGNSRHQRSLAQNSLVELFTCGFCDQYFDSQEELTRHESQHKKPVGNNIAPGNSRQQQSSSQNSLGEFFTCGSCDLYFDSQEELRNHESQHKRPARRTSIANFPPRQINSSGDPISAIELKPSLGSDPAQNGDSPQKRWPRRTRQVRSLIRDLHANFFPCESCDEYFETQEELDKHAIVHKRAFRPSRRLGSLGESLGGPERSGRKIKRSRSLIEGFFPCGSCDQYFPTQEQLDLHELTHKKSRRSRNLPGENLQQVKLEKLPRQTGGSNPPQFSCRTCDQYFETRQELAAHEKAHGGGPTRGQKVYQCPCCKKQYSSNSTLWKHKKKFHPKQLLPRLKVVKSEPVKTEASKKDWTCPICGKVLSNYKSLWAHKKNVHGPLASVKTEPTKPAQVKTEKPVQSIKTEGIKSEGPKPAAIKPEAIKSEGIKTENFPESHTCKVCNKSFLTYKGLAIHAKLHTDRETTSGEKPQCQVCNEEFANIETLLDHLKSHSTRLLSSILHIEKPTIECKLCKKVFMSNAGLVSHLKTHTSAKVGGRMSEPVKVEELGSPRGQGRMSLPARLPSRTVKCKICGVVVPNRGALANHVKIHTMQRQSPPSTSKCTLCPKKCLTPWGLQKHIRFAHPSDLPRLVKPSLKCRFCHKSFPSSDLLTPHLKLHAKAPGKKLFKCSVCKKTTATKFSMMQHMRQHNDLYCEKCDESFPSPMALRVHKGWHLRDDKDTGEYSCYLCQLQFTVRGEYRLHMKTHLAPFKCRYCDKDFQHLKSLKNHEMVHHGSPGVGDDDKAAVRQQLAMIAKKNIFSGVQVKTEKTERCYKCTECNTTFENAKSLRLHVLSSHTF